MGQGGVGVLGTPNPCVVQKSSELKRNGNQKLWMLNGECVFGKADSLHLQSAGHREVLPFDGLINVWL